MIEGFNEIDAIDRIKREYDIVLKMTEVNPDHPDGILNM